MKRAFRVHPADNVATLLADAKAETVEIVPAGGDGVILLSEAIEYGHKIALIDLPAGELVVKYGIPIGVTTRTIRCGAWVHLHNCASAYDTRSTTLDVASGTTTDTPYV